MQFNPYLESAWFQPLSLLRRVISWLQNLQLHIQLVLLHTGRRQQDGGAGGGGAGTLARHGDGAVAALRRAVRVGGDAREVGLYTCNPIDP